MAKFSTLIAAGLALWALVCSRAGLARDAPRAAPQALCQLGGISAQVHRMPLGHGELWQIYYATPSRPKAVLIMFPGGTGYVGFDGAGRPCHGDNFLVRTSLLWLARNYAVLIPDPMRGVDLHGLRSKRRYSAIIGRLTRFAHKRDPAAPVFYVGTSQGSIAAMNGAAHATRGNVSGIVLTESVAMPGKNSQETVFSADPARVRVPALIVANKKDRFYVALPIYARGIKHSLIHSADVEIQPVEGGKGPSKGCSSLSSHGYYGIEPEVVDLIDQWLRHHIR